ncbi:MAG: hypothetical protein HQL46_03695 [Gammaproteobacteria bacterium]|nr:hypothetical protein [Gammaproteobacteria bacterium]
MSYSTHWTSAMKKIMSISFIVTLTILAFVSLDSFSSEEVTSISNKDSHKNEFFSEVREQINNSILILKESDKKDYTFPGNYYFQPRTNWASSLEQKIRDDLSFYEVKSQQIKETVSSSALNTTSKLIQSMNPKIVVIALGENDGLYSKNIKDIKMYLATIIRTAINNRSKVVLVGNRLPIRYGTTYITEFAEMYAQLAKQYGIAYVPEDKFAYTYPMFVYHYSLNAQDASIGNNRVKSIWKKLEQFVEEDKKVERNAFYIRDFYRFPQVTYGR